jgi:hypothetical protein
MQKQGDDRSSQKNDFENIAAILAVPVGRQAHFVDEAIRISNFINDHLDFEHYLPGVRKTFSVAPVKKANHDFKKSIQLLRENWLALNRAIPVDVSRDLAQLLNHPSARALLPESIQAPLVETELPADKLEHQTLEDGCFGGQSRHPADAFLALMELQQSWLETILKRPKNGGGGKSKWLRAHCLAELLVLHNDAFDERAVSTPKGKFCTMCSLLLDTFGESTVGLDEAINRFLREQRAKAS